MTTVDMPPRLAAAMNQDIGEEVSPVLQAAMGGMPRMGEPPSTTVELMRGVYVGGRWQKTVTVRELTGMDEEKISKFDFAKRPVAEFVNEIIVLGTEKIGDIDTPKDMPGLFLSLLTGDRDLIFLAIVKATHGEHREAQAECSSCGTNNTITFDVDDAFPVSKVDPDLALDQPVAVTLRSGAEALFALPTGRDIIAMAQNRNATTAERNTIFIAATLVTVDGAKVSDPTLWARKLGLADRDKIVRVLNEIAPGPRAEGVKVACVGCGESLSVGVGWADLLFG